MVAKAAKAAAKTTTGADISALKSVADQSTEAQMKVLNKIANTVQNYYRFGETFAKRALSNISDVKITKMLASSGIENVTDAMVKEVRNVVEGLRTDVNMQRTLEQTLNAQNDQVMEKLRATFPRWKEEDFLLYLFTASGFSSTTLSTLLEKDKPYIYNRLYRLKERIKVSGTRDRDLFLGCLER